MPLKKAPYGGGQAFFGIRSLDIALSKGAAISSVSSLYPNQRRRVLAVRRAFGCIFRVRGMVPRSLIIIRHIITDYRVVLIRLSLAVSSGSVSCFLSAVGQGFLGLAVVRSYNRRVLTALS